MIDVDFIRAAGSIFEAKDRLTELGLPPTDSVRSLEIARRQLASGDQSDQDYGMTALWCLASLGNRDAASFYASAVERYVSENEMPQAQATHFSAIAANWRKHVDASVDLEALMGSAKNTDTYPYTPLDFAEKPDTEMTKPGLRLLHAIGDPLSTEGRNLSNRFSPILDTVVPRRGLIPAKGAISEAITMRYPWAVNAAQAVERSLTLIRETGATRAYSKPLLFLGEKGTGKTSLAMFVANLLGRHCVKLPAAGTSDSASLAATPRGWSNFKASLPAQAILESNSCDPCIIIDELDKASRPGSQNGSIMGTLLGMLDLPDARYYDTALMANIDISGILFMATANRLDLIPEELADRFTLVPIPRPSEKHFDTVIADMRVRAAERLGVQPFAIPTLDDVEYTSLKSFFTSSRGSLRSLNDAYEVALASAFERERQITRM